MDLRVVFFGTPEFAVPSLERLVGAGARVALTVTQPDRPSGRHRAPRPSAIGKRAASLGIPVQKPERLRGEAGFLETLREASPDVGVVVAYGRILPTEILAVPRLGLVNVHASLLPRYRGASPIQAALLAGDRETGVVTMRVVDELDAGPLYLERRVEIGERETASSLSRTLALVGADLLVETLAGLERGEMVASPQRGTATFCRPIRREEGKIDWTRSAAEIERRMRAFDPWPGLYTFLDGERIKVCSVEPGPATDRIPGTLWLDGEALRVACGDGGSLTVARVQRAGRLVVAGREFALGIRSLPARFA